ncbi:phenylalanine--tRNA ligase subunit beta [Candidatus Cloacimonadota bacterium]
MKISYNWLKQYIDLQLSPQELEEKLTFAGIEVEAVEKIGEELKQIKIAEIIEHKAHPESDHLSICQVNDGSETVQVICGAPNCAAGQKIAFAPVGTKIGEFKIKKAKLRGEVSFGMICSEKELGISDNHDGILVLPEDAPIGTSMSSYLKTDDVCYDVEITPNRPDLLGMLGVARDLSAILGQPIQYPQAEILESNELIEDHLALENIAPELCTRYTARMIKGVTVQESPEWLKQYLLAVGLRPINNVVDVTNFVMMEYGHPLHAFDFHLIEDKKIIVRTARKNEKFPALDEETYILNESDLVIADSKKAIALAGVIGGENSHITETTKDIVIEAANFLYSSVRKTAGRLKISTDSAYRFERDIADETAELASQRATQLILELAGGTLMKGMLDSYPNPIGERIVSIRPSRVKLLLTIDLTNEEIKSYLTALGLELKDEQSDNLSFSIPAYRKDLVREVDLIEEIIRLHGYNNVETFLKTQQVMNREVFYTRRQVADILVNNGFSEVKNWNFTDPEDLDKLKIPDDDERRNNAVLMNPLGSRFSIMRSMLLPHLLNNTLFNLNHGTRDLKIFEMSKVFFRKDEKLANEKLHVSGLLTGKLNPTYWKEQSREVDFYDVKGIIEEILESLNIVKYKIEKSAEAYFQPGLGADIIYRNKTIAVLGKIDPKILEKFDIEEKVYSFDIDLDTVFNFYSFADPIFRDIPKFPPVLRDLSFVISKEHSYNEIVKSMKQVNPGIIKKVELFDEFTGKNIKDGFRSLTFSIVFSSDTKTLTDEIINKNLQKVIEKLKKEFSIVMR